MRIGGFGPAVAQQLSFNVPDQEAALHLVEIARALFELISHRCVDLLLTHPYEGGHPDHDAVAFAAHAAIRMQTALRPNGPSTALGELAFYHAAGGALEVATFLTVESGSCDGQCAGLLDDAECATRRAMLDAFASQRDVLAIFDRSREPLRCAPSYDFTLPPHLGPLHYERLPFGWSGSHWREVAQEALRVLTLL